jgi:hypothetical protein
MSPGGAWIASRLFQIPRAGGEYFQSLIVAHASGTPRYTLVEGWFPLLPGYKIAEPLYNGSDLTLLELATGETKELLAADTTIKLGLAPDEMHVAYQAMGEQTLVIRHLNSGETRSLDLADLLGNDQMGAIVWSPDSNMLAFVVAHNPCSGGWAESTSIYTLDRAEMGLVPQLERDERLLIPIAWEDGETLLL